MTTMINDTLYGQLMVGITWPTCPTSPVSQTCLIQVFVPFWASDAHSVLPYLPYMIHVCLGMTMPDGGATRQ